MTSWVYLFSQFTPEALLIEGLIIFILCCGYTAFWILKKRRYGVIETALPAGPVKNYLNELIANTEQLRAQLFGLLASTTPTRTMQIPASMMPGMGDPEFAGKLALLEAQMAEQTKALNTINVEKSRLEKELENAREGAAALAPSSNKEDEEMIKKLQAKIQMLEGRLAEYSVIEDDLANLKRFQQENAQLKATLAGKGIPMPAGGTEGGSSGPSDNNQPPPAATGSSETAPSGGGSSPAPTPSAGAQAPLAEGDELLGTPPASQTPATEPAPPPPAAAAPAAAEAAASAAAPANPSAPAAPASASPPASEPAAGASAEPAAQSPAEGTHEKPPEEDLVAEFEKMLKS